MIDVLLATYNAEKYLKRQLDSIFAQKVDVPFRVLVSDDGSTDGTLAILKAYGDRIKMVSCPHEKGAKGNFLSLLKITDAPYAAFCDQDDIWHDNKLRLSMDAMREMEKGKDIPCLTHTDLCVVDQNEKLLYPSMFAHQGFDKDAVTLNRLLVQNNATGCTMLLNRALIDLCNQADEKDVYMHDWWIALIAAATGKITFIDEQTVSYRQHGRNVIGASQNSLFRRALSAFAIRKKLKDRIALTYPQAQRLLDYYQDHITKDKSACLRYYIAIEPLNKLHRFMNLNRGGYWMQNRIQRIGQILFL